MPAQRSVKPCNYYPALDKEINNPTTHPPPGTWNALTLVTAHEVAEWARVHPKTAYRWIKLEMPEDAFDTRARSPASWVRWCCAAGQFSVLGGGYLQSGGMVMGLVRDNRAYSLIFNSLLRVHIGFF